MASTFKRMAAQAAAHQSWANTADRAARTAPARAALRLRFETEVDPDGLLAPAERSIRAEHARKAHYLRMALKSAQARSKSLELISVAKSAEAELAALGGAYDAA